MEKALLQKMKITFLNRQKPRIELGCALSSDQDIKLSGKVPFVAFEQPIEPSFQAQTKDSHKSYIVDR